jgi:hypothetical protein
VELQTIGRDAGAEVGWCVETMTRRRRMTDIMNNALLFTNHPRNALVNEDQRFEAVGGVSPNAESELSRWKSRRRQRFAAQ